MRVGAARQRISFGLLLLVCLLCLSLLASSAETPAQPQAGGIVQAPHGSLRLVSENQAIAPGEKFTLGLLFTLDPHWHIYWMNPGDSGEPPRVNWTLPQGFSAGAIQWPVPKRLPAGPLMDFGYEGQVLLPVDVQAPANAAGEVPIHAAVRWLVCSDVCIPAKAELDLKLPVKPGTVVASEAAALFRSARASLPTAVPDSWKPALSDTQDAFTLKVNAGKSLRDASFFPSEANLVEPAAPQKLTRSASGISLTLKKSDEFTGSPRLRGVLVDSNGRGYEITVPADAQFAPASAGTSTTTPPNSGASSGQGTIAATNPVQGAASASIFPGLQALLLAFLGGIALNVMPCVFPVLSLKLLAFVNAGHEDRARLRRHGLIYSAGIVVSFWALVALLLLLRHGGMQAGWGFQLQSPAFIAFLASLLTLMALNLIGVFEIGYGLMGAGSKLAARGGYSGSFFTGVLATVVATPCTAPFMGAAVGFALAQPVSVAVAIFTALALGMAAPFLVLSLAPGWIRLLPRPGRWMETLKQLFAFPLLATVVWLVWVFGQQTSIDAVARLLGLLLVVAIAAWVAGRWASARWSVAVALVLLLAGALWFRGTDLRRPAVAQAATGGEWEQFTPERLAQYRSQGRPVFVDFTAAWCLTCQVNERVALRTEEFRDAVRRKGVVLLKADWTSYDPAITGTLASLGRSAVPLYVIYDKGSAPTILPEGLLTAQQVVRSLERVGQGG